ncbi:MAG: hypothetical protein QXU23_07305, partial [Candidatus Korarchaeum sp.]
MGVRMYRATKFILALMVALLMLPSLAPASAAPVEFKPNEYGWFDSIVFFEESDGAKAVEMMIKGDMDAYFEGIDDPDLYRKIKQSPELSHDLSFGMYFEL